MATLGEPIDFPDLFEPTFEAGFAGQVAALEALQKTSDDLEPGEIVGALLRFQVADGYAWYKVVSHNTWPIPSDKDPLTVSFVAFGDDYTIPDVHLRGLTADDVLEQLSWRRTQLARQGRAT